MFLVGTSQVHITVAFKMYMKCIWWEHAREMGPVPSMFLTCSHLFPEALAPSVRDAGLPGEFWAEAVSTACYLKNLTSTHHHPGRTPLEAWTGRRLDVAHLRPFGC